MDALKSQRFAAAALLSLIVLLPACGGGGSDASANAVPIANAGAALRVLVPGTVVTLDGRGSSDANGQALTAAAAGGSRYLPRRLLPPPQARVRLRHNLST